jgi:hypothetical protein
MITSDEKANVAAFKETVLRHSPIVLEDHRHKTGMLVTDAMPIVLTRCNYNSSPARYHSMQVSYHLCHLSVAWNARGVSKSMGQGSAC